MSSLPIVDDSTLRGVHRVAQGATSVEVWQD
jgi:hypothetical protein